MNSSARPLAVILAGLTFGSAALSPMRDFVKMSLAGKHSVQGEVQSRQVTARWTDAVIPGGLRALAADGLWLKIYGAWVARDPARTEGLIRLATLVDSRPLSSWINGARILAYDIPEWRMSSCGVDAVPLAVRRRIVDDQARAGLRLLDAARKYHGDDAAIWVEMGNIELYRRRDLIRGAECFRHAADLPDAPYYAARIYAELLRKIGRDREAYAWLCRIHPALPIDNEAAMSGLVLSRIRELEGRLNIPAHARYLPSCDSPAEENMRREID